MNAFAHISQIFSKIGARFYLRRWARKNTAEGFDDIRIKRRYETAEAYVDLYWIIRSKHGGHTYPTYQRLPWTNLKKAIKKAEAEDLKNEVLLFLKDRKD